MPEAILDLESLLDSAEREMLLEEVTESFFPVRRRGGFVDFYQRLEEELRAQDVLSVVEYRSVKEGFVKVSRPSRLRLAQEDLLRRRPYLQALAREVSLWRRQFADLGAEVAIRRYYRDLTADPGLTRACFEVLRYLLAHRDEVRGLLARQVQHTESTKLIGREPLLLRLFGVWRGEDATWEQFFRCFELLERPVEFRFYAPICSYQGAKLVDFHGVLTAEMAPRFDFSASAGTLLVENVETFYSESTRRGDRLIVWGGGWKAVLIRTMAQLLPRPILYWGDMDKEGYEIFGLIKSYIPDIRPTLMDRKTLESYAKFAVAKEPFFGPYRSAGELQAEYQEVCQRGICIEQEKIHDRPC